MRLNQRWRQFPSGKSNTEIISEKFYPYLLAVILIFSLIIRLLGLNKGIWIDDSASIYMFSQENLGKTIQELRTDTHPPLYFLLLHFWAKINNSDLFLRFPSIFFSVATVYVTMKWLKSYSNLSSVLAGLFFATSPIMLRYAHEIRGYSLLTFATALTFLFASYVTNKPEKIFGYIGLAFSLIIAVSTHMIGIMLVIPICVFIALMTKLEQRKIHWLKIIATITIPCILFSFFYLFFLNSDNAKSRINWFPDFSFDLISFTANYIIAGYSTLYYPSFLDHFVTFVIFAGFSSLLFLAKSKLNLVLLLTTIIYWLQLVIYSLFQESIVWFTTVLPTTIPLIGFVALQIDAMKKKNIKRGFIAGFTIVCLLFTGLWVTHEAWKPLEEYKQVGEYLESQWRPDDVVVISPGYIVPTIGRYWSNFPSQTVIDVDNKSSLAQLVAAVKNHRSSPTIFFCIRVDLGTHKKLETYQTILSAIESNIQKLTTVQVFVIISNGFQKVDKFQTIDNLLKLQSSQLGKPLSYQDHGSYLSLKYKLHK